jgi:CDGSH iron-sulfur domain-containing protein 3
MANVKIQALKNGPLLISGEIEVVDGEGKPLTPAKQPAAFCRCGHSASKPFCDGTHRKNNFQA